MIDLVNQTLGQYHIEALLGSGGMGQVFRGRHIFLDRQAAIKVMHANLAADPTFRARFLREARAAATLKHPNIVEVYEFGEQSGHLYLVMELMTSGSVRTLLQREAGQPLPLALGLDLVRQAAEGLAAAHAQGIVHRDIKPDNLLLNPVSGMGQATERYQLKISDFGLARMAEGGGLSTSAGPMGTLAYMSPEQCQSLPLDGRSDLYSLGVVLYEVTTGYQPFQINTLSDAFNKHVNVAPRPPREVYPNLPPRLEAIILRCLAKKPEERYANATELAAALKALLDSITSSLTPVGEIKSQSPGAGAWSPPAVFALPDTSVVPRVRVLDQSGQTLQAIEIKRQGLIVGRESGNDIVLPSQTVSRHHLQVLWDGKQVSVKDLGSSNGTLLEGIRLLPQESQPWQAEQWVYVGPYWLRLEEANLQGTQLTARGIPQTSMAGVASVQQAPSVTPEVSSRRIGIVVTPTTLSLTPGQAETVQVSLTNLGNTVDWFTTTVEGVPPDWVQETEEAVQLNPGMHQTVGLNVNVARGASNQAGDYPVTILSRSREKPNEAGIVRAHWLVLPFKEDAVELKPRRASGRGRASYTIMLHNGGNAPSQYALSGEDDEQKLAYTFSRNPVALEAGREVDIPLQVNTQRHWFGKEQRQPFQVHAHPTGSSSPLTAPGEFVNKALIPTWVLSAVGVVLAVGLVLGLLLPGILKGSTPTPTPSPTVVPSAVTTVPFQVTTIDMSVSPDSIEGETCGTQLTVTYTATFNVPPNSPGGTIHFTYTTDGGSTSKPAVVQFDKGQTSKEFQFTSTGALDQNGSFPKAGQVTSTSPNSISSQIIVPSGSCQDKYAQATSGTPVLDDPLIDNSKGYGWDVSSGFCQFIGGSLHVSRATPGAINCNATGAGNFSNFAFQVQMMIIKGDAGGINFRSASGSGYYFSIGQDGSYKFYRDVNYSLQTIKSGSSAAIHTGLGQTNLVTVIAQGNTFEFYVNKQYITTVTDSTNSQGSVGVVAFDNNNPTEVVFNNAKVWTL